MVFNYQSAPSLVVIGGVFVWLVGLTVIAWWRLRQLQNLAPGALTETVSRQVKQLGQDLNQLTKQVQDNQRAAKWLKTESINYIQKMGLVRFNPFGDTGGDQSFAVALLNGNNDGLVISSLHGRTGNRIYAKIIQKGKATKHELSKEETEAVLQAMSAKGNHDENNSD